MKKIVVIGGGHGQSVILRGLKLLEDVELSTIVTVADDGGSTGRLRRQFHIPAMGDIRNVMVALSEEENLLSRLMNYRFQKDDNSEMSGHNLGNLILTALSEETGSFMEAIQMISKVLNVKGNIIPATTQVITLFARMEDGTIVRGEENIPNFDNRISEVFYEEEVVACPEAVERIVDADYIVIGIGSLYTSILPNLIIKGILDAITRSKAKRIYFCNAMSQPGETDGYSLEDHVRAIEKQTYPGFVQVVVKDNDDMGEAFIQKYGEKGAIRVRAVEKHHDYQLIHRDLLDFSEGLVRHDSHKIYECMKQIIEEDEDVLYK